MKNVFIMLVAGLALTFGQAQAQEQDDPWEGFNKGSYKFS